MESGTTYQRGDWIVHRHYGVGQIKGMEQRSISGETTRYCRISADNSTFWVPLEMLDQYLRPLVTQNECQEIVHILQRPPRKMHRNFRKRQSRIREVKKSDSLLDMARLIRDLEARSTHTNLNGTEQSALRDLKRRFLSEWRTSMGYEESEAKRRLKAILDFDEEPVPYRNN
jgi:RNA polymerase-interacting CarD/CdnL/TRCF family regulator